MLLANANEYIVNNVENSNCEVFEVQNLVDYLIH